MNNASPGDRQKSQREAVIIRFINVFSKKFYKLRIVLKIRLQKFNLNGRTL